MKNIALILLGFSSLLTHAQTNQIGGSRPKLVVGIVVDQMSYEYLYRYYAKYGEGGFKRLMNNGTNCRTTNYNYVPTYTGPGHASIYTGTTPENHGIVGNDWYHRKSNTSINCVQDDSVLTVGSTSVEGRFSPTRLKGNTITDQLKMTYPNSKVVSLSIKNRGAILPGGHLSDGSYWFDYATGDFITSTYFKSNLPDWVNDFNAKNYPQVTMNGTWNTLYDISKYTESGVDNSAYEHLLPGKLTPTFPYELSEMKDGINDMEIFTTTPFANTFLKNFALKAIESESLGKDKETDMLCISFSTPDIIGHEFGPQSIEIEDTYLRLDKDIEDLLNYLDKTIGQNEYVLFLTADHAVVPVPQYFIDNKMPGGYVFLSEPLKTLKGKLNTKFGDSLIITPTNLNIYLNHEVMKAKNMNYEEVTKFIQYEIMQWEGVKNVYTSTDLLRNGTGDKWFEMVRNGFNPNESGDLVFILEAGYLPKGVDSELARKGTSHGSPFAYDTHVPLLWYGKNVPKQSVVRNIEIIDIAPTLALILETAIPHVVTGKPIVEIFGK